MSNITIEVIGPGCYFCKKLYKRVGEVVAEQDIDADIVHVTDIKTVLRYIPFTPVLKVNGKIVHRGKRLPEKTSFGISFVPLHDQTKPQAPHPVSGQ